METQFKVGDIVIHRTVADRIGTVTDVHRKGTIYRDHTAVQVLWEDNWIPVMYISTGLRIMDEEEVALHVLGTL